MLCEQLSEERYGPVPKFFISFKAHLIWNGSISTRISMKAKEDYLVFKDSLWGQTYRAERV